MGRKKRKHAAKRRPEAQQSNETGGPSQAPAGSGVRRWGVYLLVAAALAVGMWLGLGALLRWPDTSRLPNLPDLSGRPAALIEHLQQADRAARNDPTSSDAVGALAMAYHADDLHDRATRCYDLARELDPGEWRWHYYAALVQESAGATESAAERFR